MDIHENQLELSASVFALLMHLRVGAGPDETGFLPVHDIVIDTCISKFFCDKNNFYSVFVR